jgi:hypothetical protein
MEDASDTRIQVNLILVELFGKYVPVHYFGVVSLGLDWQLNKDRLRQEVMNIILNMKTEQFEKIFDDWLKRCKKCVERGLRRENLLLLDIINYMIY